MKDKQKGFYAKYNVERTDGKPVGACMVLEFKDRRARVALNVFREEVKKEGYNALADDIKKLLQEYSLRDRGFEYTPQPKDPAPEIPEPWTGAEIENHDANKIWVDIAVLKTQMNQIIKVLHHRRDNR